MAESAKEKMKKFPGKCAVGNCLVNYRTGGDDLQLFKFPKDPAKRRKWMNACNIEEEDMLSSAARVCHKHFAAEFLGGRRLPTYAIPTLHLVHDRNLDVNPVEEKKDDQEEMKACEHTSSPCNDCLKIKKKLAFYMNRNCNDKKIIKQQRSEINTLRRKNMKLQRDLVKYSQTFDLDSYMDSCGFSTNAKILCTMLIKNKCSWNDAERTVAQNIYNANAKCYNFLRNDLKLNLPSTKSLSRWANCPNAVSFVSTSSDEHLTSPSPEIFANIEENEDFEFVSYEVSNDSGTDFTLTNISVEDVSTPLPHVYSDNALRYLAGFILFKSQEKFNCENCKVLFKAEASDMDSGEEFVNNNNFDDYKEHSKLKSPSDEFLAFIKFLYRTFQECFNKYPCVSKSKEKIVDECIAETGKISNWFNDSSPCIEHRKFMLNSFVLILIRKCSMDDGENNKNQQIEV